MGCTGDSDIGWGAQNNEAKVNTHKTLRKCETSVGPAGAARSAEIATCCSILSFIPIASSHLLAGTIHGFRQAMNHSL